MQEPEFVGWLGRGWEGEDEELDQPQACPTVQLSNPPTCRMGMDLAVQDIGLANQMQRTENPFLCWPCGPPVGGLLLPHDFKVMMVH